jgi:bifunctional DNase/RNase
MSEMIEVVIDSIRVSLMSQQRIVILRERQAERYLPIWIGIYEAESITIALQEVEVARPLTHDLLRNVFQEMGARVVRVEVVAMRDDTYFGNIVAEANGRVLNIDSRPSDAIAIAVRTHVPILVARSVMEVAGITPEEDLQDEDLEKGKLPAQPQQPARKPSGSEAEGDQNEERLSVFSDFLEKLDLENLDKDNDEEDKDE